MPVTIIKGFRQANPDGYRDTKTEAERKFYGSGEWKRIRAEHRRLEPFCRDCKARGIFTAGQMVDHIKSIRKGGSPTDPANLQTLCHSCHDAKRQRERHAS